MKERERECVRWVGVSCRGGGTTRHLFPLLSIPPPSICASFHTHTVSIYMWRHMNGISVLNEVVDAPHRTHTPAHRRADKQFTFYDFWIVKTVVRCHSLVNIWHKTTWFWFVLSTGCVGRLYRLSYFFFKAGV